MSVVPTKIPEKLAWFQTRQAAWTTNATAIGILTAEMTTMSGYISAAATALSTYNTAHAAARDATVALHDASRIMGDYGADLIKKIRAKAGQVGGDSVYVLASVPPPATPAPIGELGKPTDFQALIDERGALTLTWKNANPRGATGTVYQVWRRIGAAGPFVCLGGVGEKKYTDPTVPAGTESVTYQIQAVRSTSTGPWASYTVLFGVSGGGATTITSVTESTPTRLAA